MADCRFTIQADERTGSFFYQCVEHQGSGPARCKAVAAELERRMRTNPITAGAAGELTLFEGQVGAIPIRQLPEDELALWSAKSHMGWLRPAPR